MNLEDLHATNPYLNFPIGLYPTPEIIGWHSNSPMFERLVMEVRPRLIIEVGTWLGASAITMARAAEKHGLDCNILCIDTWLGALDHFQTDYLRLRRENGYPSVYKQFMANVIHEGLQRRIIPFPQTSIIAARWLTSRNVAADMVYIDASHDYEDVLADIESYAKLVRPGGVLFGDDIGIDGVRLALHEWCQKNDKLVEVYAEKWVMRM